MIVLAVLGALAAIAVPQLTGLQGEARLAGTATTVSSELNGAFAKAMANGNLDDADGGVDWTSNLCERADSSWEAVSPTLEESDYKITGLLIDENGSVSDNGSASDVDMKAVVSVPRYESENDRTSEVGKGNAPEKKICYLSITNS